MERVLTTGEAARMLGITKRTLRRWIDDGHVEGAFRTAGGKQYGHWRVPFGEVQRLRNDDGDLDGNRAALYARAREEDEDLVDRALTHLTRYAAHQGYQIVDVIREVAPGVEGQRDGLRRLREYVSMQRIDVIVVERMDRIMLVGAAEFERWTTASLVIVEEAGVHCKAAEQRYAQEIFEDLFFPLADALALATDRTRAEQATARALGEVWDFLAVGVQRAA
jgi:excisionase family DNA binding protein